MTRDTLNPPSTRSWRDIPQPVVPRAMSREGRLRLLMSTLRVAAGVGLAAVCVWGGWIVFSAAQENTRAMPAAAKAAPVKPPELRTDGVLDRAWLARTLAIPAKASLLELDLDPLHARLLAEPQVASATLTKKFPDRLIVTIAERSPVARVMIHMLGEERALLVARDGVIYVGAGYDRATIDSLPWLDGVTIQPAGGGFRPIPGMPVAAELLSKARLEAEHLYANWAVVSLARLDSDHRLEVRTKDGRRLITFSTDDDFFRQLAKLDYIADTLAARAPDADATVDLSLGQDVPVMLTPAKEAGDAEASKAAHGFRSAPDARHHAVAVEATRGVEATSSLRSPAIADHASSFGRRSDSPDSRPAAQSAFFILPTRTSNTKREL